MHEQTGLLTNELYNGKGVNFGLTDDEEKGHENNGEIRSYKSRWLQLTLFCLLSMSNGILWITFSPISNQVQNYYNVSSFYVNSLSMVYMFLFVLLVFPSSWLLDSDTSNRNPVGWEKWVTTGRGLRAAMLIAALGTAGSAILRCFSWPSENGFTVVFLGQMVGGAVQPLILNAPPMVAANWFPAEQRTIATTICSVANPIGVAFGFVIPPTFAGTSLFEPRVELVLLVEAVICIVVAILVIVLFREQPPHPPSLSKSSAKISIPLFTSLRTLFTDRNFVILLIGGGCSLGAFNTMATLLNYIIEPYGYNNFQSGVIGAMVVFFGIVGSGVAGVIVDKTRLYKGVLIACFFLSFIFTALFIVFLQRDKFIELTLMCSMFGFFMTPTLPLTLELGCEITYPINEATPSGLLVGGGQVIGILLILISGLLIDAGHVHAACWIVVGCILFAGWLMLMFYGTLHRMMTEKHISQQLALKNDESYFSN